MVGLGPATGRTFARLRVGVPCKCLAIRSHWRIGGDAAEASNIRNTCAEWRPDWATRDVPAKAPYVDAAAGDAYNEKAAAEGETAALAGGLVRYLVLAGIDVFGSVAVADCPVQTSC